MGGGKRGCSDSGGLFNEVLICRTNFLREKQDSEKQPGALSRSTRSAPHIPVGIHILMKTIHRNRVSSFMNERIFMNSIFFNSINPKVKN